MPARPEWGQIAAAHWVEAFEKRKGSFGGKGRGAPGVIDSLDAPGVGADWKVGNHGEGGGLGVAQAGQATRSTGRSAHGRNHRNATRIGADPDVIGPAVGLVSVGWRSPV